MQSPVCQLPLLYTLLLLYRVPVALYSGSRKKIYFCFIDYAKAFDRVDHNKLKNSERDGNTRPPDLPQLEWRAGKTQNKGSWEWEGVGALQVLVQSRRRGNP